MKYSVINQENNEDIPINTGDVTVIGRGSFGIIDKRISKRHGEITCTAGDNQIKVKSCHKNPIFYKKYDDEQKKILYENTEICLCNNDTFLLLPDSHEFKVKIYDENEVESTTTSTAATSSGAFRVRNITEINDNLETGDIPVTYSQVMQDTTDEIQPQVSSSSIENRKRSHSDSATSQAESAVEEDAAKKPKIEPVKDETPASSSSAPLVSVIKPDPDSTNSNDQKQNSTTMPSASNVNVKQEPDSSSVKTEDTSNDQPAAPAQPHQNLRSSCDFGVRCFRHTPEHRQEFAHPGDADYRRPAFPPAAPNSPRCPFWESCYRRNPDHFRQFEHPSSSAVYNPVQPPPVQPRQPLVNVAIFNYNNDDDEHDDDEEEDIFYNSDDTDVDRDYEIDGSESPDEEEVLDDEDNLEE